jgi:hypothetical protein
VTELRGYSGSISFDGHVIKITKTLRGSQSFPVNSVSGVSIANAGIGYRAIRFSVAGGSIATPAMGFKQFVQDPFALAFLKKDLAAFEALQSEVLTAIAR